MEIKIGGKTVTEKELYTSQLDKISDEKLRIFTQMAIEQAPYAFWTIPASSTGKHHPPQSQGEGGLVRHVLAALYFGREFCIAYCLDQEQRDIITSALLLHDIGKAIAEPHDIVYATKLRRLYKKNFADNMLIDATISCVRWHMGRWSTGSSDCQYEEHGDKLFPNGFSMLEQIVHLADYAASRKRCDLTKLEI